MNPATLALLLVAVDPYPECADSPAATLCRERKRAHDKDDMHGMHELVEREVAAVRAVVDSTERLGPIKIGALQPLCLPLEAGFNLCNEWHPEDECADDYLARYAAEGCLADYAQRPRYHNMHAMYWHRRMDYPATIEHLQHAESAAWALWLTQWNEKARTNALLSVVISMSLRAQIAANLRNTEALRAELAALELIRAHLVQQPDLTTAVAGTTNALAWSLLMAREAELTTEDPTPLLTAALVGFVQTRPDRRRADDVRINLALAALHRDDLAATRRWAAEVETTELGDEGRMWLRLVQIRTEMRSGDPEATADWQAELDAVATRGRVAMAPWFAEWARGLRMEAAGRPGAAIAAFEGAEAALESLAHSGAGSGALADRLYLSFSDATRRLVRILVEADQLDRAVWVVRHARSRALRATASDGCAEAQFVRDDRPDPTELRLIYFRVSARADAAATTRWVGLAVGHDDVHAASMTLPPVPIDLHAHGEALAEWSDALLGPFDQQIADATAIEILATDALHAVPFHALPWDGEELIDHAPVLYGLDLSTCGDDEAGPPGPALVVSSDDPRLVNEAGVVTRALQNSGRLTEVLLPRDQEALDSVLAGPHTTLHVAAHGARPEGRGMFAFDDRLLLPGTLTLSRQSILASAHTPALVFLSACQASFADGETLGGGISLAHAFLLRGSRFVVGPVDDIDGEVARRLAVRFYEELGGGDLTDVATAWRAAYQWTRATIRQGDLKHLRMLRLHAR
jgi:hypothetical protein